MTWFIEPLAEGRQRVAVSGELDLAAEQPFFDGVSGILRDRGTHHVVLDLSGVEFIDSSGVRALVRLRHAHAERVVLGLVSERVKAVLEIAGIDDRFGQDGASSGGQEPAQHDADGGHEPV